MKYSGNSIRNMLNHRYSSCGMIHHFRFIRAVKEDFFLFFIGFFTPFLILAALAVVGYTHVRQ